MTNAKIARSLFLALTLGACLTTGTVSAQSDEKGPVVLPTANTAIVPNVVGMSYLQAIPVIQNAGFYAKSNLSLSLARNKVVISQVPAAGSRAYKNTFVVATVQP